MKTTQYSQSSSSSDYTGYIRPLQPNVFTLSVPIRSLSCVFTNNNKEQVPGMLIGWLWWSDWDIASDVVHCSTFYAFYTYVGQLVGLWAVAYGPIAFSPMLFLRSGKLYLEGTEYGHGLNVWGNSTLTNFKLIGLWNSHYTYMYLDQSDTRTFKIYNVMYLPQ